MIFEIVPYHEHHSEESFHKFLQRKYPHLMGRESLYATQEEATETLRQDCWGFRYVLRPISTFVETTFTAEEMAALKVIVDHAANHCGGGEDTIGAIMYTGAFHKLNGDGAVCNLARKIDCYGD